MIAATRATRLLLLAATVAIPTVLLRSVASAQSPMDRITRMVVTRAPVRARLSILPPVQGLVVDRQATVRWFNPDDSNGVLDRKGIPSITWYYGSRPDGSDRKRAASLFHERFEGNFADSWIPVNDLRADWQVVRTTGADRRRFLRGRTGGDPLVSIESYGDAVVVSVKLRPQQGAQNFGVAVRANRDDRCFYALRGDTQRGMLELTNPLNPGLVRQKDLQEFDPQQWYWYELGVRNTKRGGEVWVRGRIWDADHQRVLTTLQFKDRAGQQNCPAGQRIALLGGADYSEVYVDPWDARWPGPPEGSFTWDTSNVPPGSYYLFAVVDGEPEDGPQRVRASDYQLTVRH